MLFDGSMANEASRALDGNVMRDWLFSLCIVELYISEPVNREEINRS